MPAIASPPDHAAVPHEINGVPVFTREGTPRQRFPLDDKLHILGCTVEELKAFADLFAPRRTHFAIRRATADDPGHWVEGRGVLGLDEIARHLLGARLPGVQPLWIAPRAWDWTRFVAVDVDYRGDWRDFQIRCQFVETALERLGVTRQFWLVMPTPSGGRHYYFFTNQRIRTAEITPTLAMVGIRTVRGRFEVFPSTAFGLRLPYGHLPQHPFDPRAWIDFISRPRRTVCWEGCKRLASELAKRCPKATASVAMHSRIDRGRRQRVATHIKKQLASETKDPRLQRYRTLLSQPIESPAEIKELYELGVREEGTRHQAMSRIAWNMVFVKGYSEAKAINRLASWAYRTGEETSKTVATDLAEGKRNVEEDAHDLIRHFHLLRDRSGTVSPAIFTGQELAAIRGRMSVRPRCHRGSYARFLLEFLKFAKRYGQYRQNSWECSVAAGGVMRTWKGCSGCRYRRYLDWAQEDGIIRKQKEARPTSDRTGRPRTFAIVVPAAVQGDSEFAFPTAFEQLTSPNACVQPDVMQHEDTRNKSDKYLVGLRPKVEDHSLRDIASDPVAQRVDQEHECKQANWSQSIESPPTAETGISANPRLPIHEHSPSDPTDSAAKQGIVEQGHVRREHSRCPPRHLAPGTPERARLGSALQSLCDPAARTEPASAPTSEYRLTSVTPRERVIKATPVPSRRLRPTPEELDELPPPHDKAAISTLVRQLKQQALAEFPGDQKRAVEFWTTIEQLARMPGLRPYDRWLLLTEPSVLTDSQLLARRSLLVPGRRPSRNRRLGSNVTRSRARPGRHLP